MDTMWRVVIASALCSSLLFAACEPAGRGPTAVGVAPNLVDQRPTCAELGLGAGLRVEPVATDTYPLSGEPGTSPFVTLAVNEAGTYFDWTSTLGVVAIIVKGGLPAHVYRYEYPGLTGQQLSAPFNYDVEPPAPFPLTYVELCFAYRLQVAKTALPSLTRRYVWQLAKSSPVSTLTLSLGQTFTVPYEVAVSVARIEDSNWKLSGEVTIHNPTQLTALVTGVADRFDGAPVDLDCDVSFPFELGPGQTLSCTYLFSAPTGSSGRDAVEVQTSGPVAGASASVEVDFAQARVEWLDCRVRVFDDRTGFLGESCVPTGPPPYQYTLNVGPYAECGEFTFANTAWFVAGDTGATASSTWNIAVTVPCASGCTRTPGYWKTHSTYGPAPYDDTWARLPAGADTPFFLSGKSTFDVLWTPTAGNVYYTLARAYIAANLNALSGADLAAVQNAFDHATRLFLRYSPAMVARFKGRDLRRALFIALAAKLDAYDNGLIGPGHCSE